VVLGELPNSFLKRRLGVPPGGHVGAPAGTLLSVIDQGDFVLASRLVLAPVWRMSGRDLMEAFAVVAIAHSVVNVVGYAIGARESAV
jgi:hypothetical protein